MRTKSTKSLKSFSYLLKTVSLALLIFFHITTKAKVAFREKYKYAKESYSIAPIFPPIQKKEFLRLWIKSSKATHDCLYYYFSNNNCFIYT